MNGGGARRQARQTPALPEAVGSSSGSPQRTHAGLEWRGISVQQASQIGTEEKRGRGDPQRVQNEGRRVQLAASTGLRSTRAMARQRVISDGGRSIVSEPKSLLKTHLAREAVANTATRSQYTDPSAVVPIRFTRGVSSDTERSAAILAKAGRGRAPIRCNERTGAEAH